MQKKRLGILTSGGDCPGLNAAIRAVVSHASLTYGWEVLGIPYGTRGLSGRKPPIELSTCDGRGVDPLLATGGTILGSASKGYSGESVEAILTGYEALGLNAIVAIGGDGSLRIVADLAERGGWNFIGIPKTIDNDVGLTESAIGFDTATNTVVDALQRLSSTAASHDRVMVVETMGRTAGHLALHSGIAGGADAILIPEVPYSIDSVCQKIHDLKILQQRHFALVVVAEGAKTLSGESRQYTDAQGNTRLRGIGDYISDGIYHRLGDRVEVRVTVLGHVQRGGMPSAFDRILASSFGRVAVDLLAAGKSGRVVVWRAGDVESVPISELCAHCPRLVDPQGSFLATARGLGTYLGEFSPVFERASAARLQQSELTASQV